MAMKKVSSSLLLLLLLAFVSVQCTKESPIPYKAPVIVDPLDFTADEKAIILACDTSMRVLTIVNHADSLVLRKKCRNVKPDTTNEALALLIDRMYKTMIARGTVGISAPQVGIERNVIWVKRMDKTNKPFECYMNVKIEMYSPNEVTFGKDSCICIPGQVGITKRSSAVSVSYNLPDGSAREELIEGHLYVPVGNPNFTAVVFQQMADHLNGILWIDRVVQ
jgi:peptide deformylase